MVSIITVQYCKSVFLNNIFFSLAYFTVRMEYIIHIMYKICVKQLFMLSVRLLVNSRLLIVKFWGSQNLYVSFPMWGVLGTLTRTLFKGQLYLKDKSNQIFYFFLKSDLAFYVFWGTCPFNISCWMYWYKVVHKIPLLPSVSTGCTDSWQFLSSFSFQILWIEFYKFYCSLQKKLLILLFLLFIHHSKI